MKNRTLFFRLSLIALSAATPFLAGCEFLRSRATKAAYNEYQQAAASGDLIRTKSALAALVRADESVPDYWAELGKLELQLGNYAKAYDALTRAHELDRTNVQILAILTRLALVSGQVDVANEHANSLALLAPGDPAVTLVRAFMALQSGNLDDADTLVDKLLADTPRDSNANIIKAQVLIARRRVDQAIALLEDQHRAVPSDRSAVRGLAALYRSRGDWRNLARAQSDRLRLDPSDTQVAGALVEALLRAGSFADARRVSGRLLAPASSSEVVANTLNIWARLAPGRVLPGAVAFAQAAEGDKRIAFANYFNRVGKPGLAAALLGAAQRPVRHTNVRWNAVFAQSLALQGRLAEAKQLFDAVLEDEPDQLEALRGRSALELRMGLTGQAIIDAQRLVSATPSTGDDRLLLARAYLAAGNKKEVRRVLWQAFQDLPDDERVFAALRGMLVSTRDLEGERRLSDELADQRMARLRKDLV